MKLCGHGTDNGRTTGNQRSEGANIVSQANRHCTLDAWQGSTNLTTRLTMTFTSPVKWLSDLTPDFVPSRLVNLSMQGRFSIKMVLNAVLSAF